MKKKMMNEKRMRINNTVIKLMILVIAIILILVVILNTMARYESEGQGLGDVDMAMYILNEDYQNMNLKLDSMEPREDPYIYDFAISNYKEGNRTDVELEYTLIVRTTTNLPLTYTLYLNQKYVNTEDANVVVSNNILPNAENVELSNNILPDDDGTYFRTLTATTEVFGDVDNELNLYKLVIGFPETYRSVEYQDIIESVEIIINSRQVLGEGEEIEL